MFNVPMTPPEWQLLAPSTPEDDGGGQPLAPHTPEDDGGGQPLAPNTPEDDGTGQPLAPNTPEDAGRGQPGAPGTPEAGRQKAMEKHRKYMQEELKRINRLNLEPGVPAYVPPRVAPRPAGDDGGGQPLAPNFQGPPFLPQGLDVSY